MDYRKIKPILKYIGGKTWMREHLRKEVSNILNTNNINHYSEPFSGALGAFLSVYDILIENNIQKVTLNDINQHLIFLYSNLKNNKKDLLLSIQNIEDEFIQTIPSETFKLHKIKDKEKIKHLLKYANIFYKEKREHFNQLTEKGTSDSALFLFLQSHCFNGIYRENKKGHYNTPFNWEAKRVDLDAIENKFDELNYVFSCFDIEFSNKSYDQLTYNEKTLYYVDPPYINEKTLIENKYNSNVFTVNDQMKLISLLKNKNFIYSNHNNQKIVNLLKENNNVDIKYISRKNIISSNSESRKNDKIEILATNRV